jgi:L-cysteate sulfo-lyase
MLPVLAMNPHYPERIEIAHLPTPIEKMERLAKHLGGPAIYIKRDDQTGLATGGNKTRKLEFLVADALARECDHLITTGALQSNHCRQTAAAAARLGLGCSLVLRGHEPERLGGNLLLDRLLGAHLYWTDDRPVNEVLQEVVDEVRAMGRKPYAVPLGGSNVIGAAGYVLAMKELSEQIAEERLNLDFIVFASSSGGTQAGLVLGAAVYGFRGRVLAISIDRPAEELKTHVAALATATATHLGLGTISVASHIEVNDDYLGQGYGILGDAEREAIRLVAQIEGILLDPVYTGRAMSGLIDLIRWGAFTRGQSVLFWHTGGLPAIFAYGDELL